MEKQEAREPLRKVLLAFGALRVIELVTLVIAAAAFDAIGGLTDGSAVRFSLVGPLLAAAAFYLSFAYIVISAAAFLLQWLANRPDLIRLANSLPLLVWGGMALWVVFGSNVPVTLILTLILGVIVNWFVAKKARENPSQ